MSEKLIQTQGGFALQIVERPPASPDELKESAQWAEKLKSARTFDSAARENYAIDRKYARGDSGDFTVDVPIAGAYVDILTSYLYSRDPDLDATPAPAVEPPPENLVRSQVEAQVQQQIAPMAQAALEQAQQAQPEQPPQPGQPTPMQEANQRIQQQKAQMIQDGIKKALEPYQTRMQEAKSFGESLQAVVKELWSQAHLTRHALPMIRSGLTVSAGWMKVTWQQQTRRSPIVQGQINTLMERMGLIASDLKQKGSVEEMKQQVQALIPKLNEVSARGLSIDFVSAENIQVSPESIMLAGYLDAPWMAEQIFMPIESAKGKFADLGSRLKSAILYQRKKPVDASEAHDSGLLSDADANDADAYSSGGADTADFGYCLVWEIWDREAGVVRTMIDGVEGWAMDAYEPNPRTQRWYPYFMFSPIQVDGERHGQSLIQRSRHLLDEYNRARSNFAEHRRRAIPKLVFDKSNLTPDEAKDLEGGGRGEMVGLKPIRPGTPVGQLLQPVLYNRVDMGLYDTSPIRAELEMVWGIQQALSSAVQVAKTATEAEIQQQGTQTRLGYMQFTRDQVFQELAEYTAQVAVEMMDEEDAQKIAGPWAIWPKAVGAQNLGSLVTVKLQAGSSGTPNTTNQQRAWMNMIPVVREGIMQIAQYRQSSPEQIADSIESLMEETFHVFNEHMDPERFLPGVRKGGTEVSSGYTPSGPPSTKVVETIPVNQPGQTA